MTSTLAKEKKSPDVADSHSKTPNHTESMWLHVLQRTQATLFAGHVFPNNANDTNTTMISHSSKTKQNRQKHHYVFFPNMRPKGGTKASKNAKLEIVKREKNQCKRATHLVYGYYST